MVRGMIIINPRDRACKDIQKLVNTKKNCHFTVLDGTSRNVSSFLYRDMRVDTLPALYFQHKNSYKIYQGCNRIKSFLSKI